MLFWLLCVTTPLAWTCSCERSWPMSVGASTPVERAAEYLPDEQQYSGWLQDGCQSKVAAAVARSAYRARGTAAFSGPTTWYQTTVGKFVHFAAVHTFWSAHQGLSPSYQMPHMSKSAVHWAALSECQLGDDAWQCLFGSYKDEGDFVCDNLWHQVTNASHVRHSLTSWYFSGIMTRIMTPDMFRMHSIRQRTLHNVADGSNKYIVVHARRGDSCDTFESARRPYSPIWGSGSRACYPWQVYREEIHRVSSKYGIRTVAVISEDPTLVEEAVKDKTFNFIWLEYDRAQFRMGKGWIENWADADDTVVDSALEALRLARGGAVLIGHMWSHFTAAALLLMTGHNGVLPPFVSVDGGGLFHVNWGSQEDALNNMHSFAYR